MNKTERTPDTLQEKYDEIIASPMSRTTLKRCYHYPFYLTKTHASDAIDHSAL